jgi:uncharacterized membrane protein
MDDDDETAEFVERMMRRVMTGELQMQLTKSKRDDLRSLLEDHQKVTDALFNHAKAAFVTTILVLDEKNDDSTEVAVHASVAKKALIAHRDWVNEELKKFGVEIGEK